MEVFRNVGAHVTTTLTDVYVVPPLTQAMVLFAQAANVDGVASVDVTVKWYDTSKADTFCIASGITIPAKSTLGLLDNSKLVLEAGDKLQLIATANGDADVTISLLEIS